MKDLEWDPPPRIASKLHSLLVEWKLVSRAPRVRKVDPLGLRTLHFELPVIKTKLAALQSCRNIVLDYESTAAEGEHVERIFGFEPGSGAYVHEIQVYFVEPLSWEEAQDLEDWEPQEVWRSGIVFDFHKAVPPWVREGEETLPDRELFDALREAFGTELAEFGEVY